MNIREAIQDLGSIRDDTMDDAVIEMEARFGILPDIVKDVILMRPGRYETCKTDPLMKLGKTGILNFEYNFDYDMLGNGMIPLFDMFDAQYIVYRVFEQDFCAFSSTAEMSVWVTKDFYELMARF